MNIFNSIADIIVRPPRSQYKFEESTDLRDRFSNNQGVGVEFDNLFGDKLYGSFFPPTPSFAPGNPCIIYLHGNASSQLEGMYLYQVLSGTGIALFTLDLDGSGNSSGQYISLGYHERDDVKVACKYLRKKFQVDNIVLWGRSMGAAIAAWCTADRSLHLSGVICDSPYISVDEIAYDMIGNSIILRILYYLISPFVDRNVKRKIGVSFHDINLIKDIKKSRVPILIVHAKEDDFIHVHQSRELFEAYGGNKKLLYVVDGNHNSPRNASTIAQQLYFALDCFELDLIINDTFKFNDNCSFHFSSVMNQSANM